MIVCVPITRDGELDPRWGRAERVAVAMVDGNAVDSWQEFEVGWGTSHDSGPEGQHHARIARFLIDHKVEAVVADHMGEGMVNMLGKMGVKVRLGATGKAREAALAASS
jgi:predicted Fe-Mo cluster-binding NifX family protein